MSPRVQAVGVVARAIAATIFVGVIWRLCQQEIALARVEGRRQGLEECGAIIGQGREAANKSATP